MKDLLASRVRNSDEQAFELLYRKHYVSLCRFSNKFLHNPEEAKDTAEEAFIKIWENRKEIDTDELIVPLLFRIAQNLSLNKLRRLKVESRYLEVLKLIYIENSDYPASDSFLTHELEKNIEIAINKLPPKCKKVFELSRMEENKYVQIADILSISIKTVEVHMSKALKFLRSELKEYL